MTGDHPPLYSPDDGLLALDERDLRAFADHAGGRRTDLRAVARLRTAGVIGDGGVDLPLRPVAGALAGRGPRMRLLTRHRGRVTVTDAAVHEDGTFAALLLRPPGSGAVHLRLTTTGGVIRHVARRLGLGARPSPRSGHRSPQTLRDWGTVLRAFDTDAPSGWAARHARASLHDLRWAPSPSGPARTALLVARLDTALADVRPGRDEGTYVVSDAEPLAVWRRMCALAAPVASATRRHRGRRRRVTAFRRARQRCGPRRRRLRRRSGRPGSGTSGRWGR